MKGRWRVFRHDGGRERRLQALVYLCVYALCLSLSYWHFARFQTVIFWPANGVLLAAFLQLPRRYALVVLGLCFLMNMSGSLLIGQGRVFAWIDPFLNLTQVLVAGLLARRFCGAALDMRRPQRLLSFVMGAALPAVVLTTLINMVVVALILGDSLVSMAFLWRHLFAMELLGLVTFTPCLLLLGQAKRFRQTNRSNLEVLGLLLLLSVTVVWVFNQNQHYLFLIFPPLLIMAYRLTPPWVAVGLILTSLISGAMTLNGLGPIAQTPIFAVPELNWAPQILRQLPIYYALLLVATMSSLALSAMVSERRFMLQRLALRDQAASIHQQRLRAAMQAKSRFLAMMSHEMRTPLNAIRGFSDLLLQGEHLDHQARKHVRSIRDSGDNLLALIEDVLEIAQGDLDQRITEFDLRALIYGALEDEQMAARAKGLGFGVELHMPRHLRVRADPHRLRSALHHIVSNAVKFTDQGEIQITGHQSGDRLTVTISDTGGGVSPDFIPHMFDMFAQNDMTINRRHSGAGVGLPSARRHARIMGGDVRLVSTSARGTTLELSVCVEPVAHDEKASTDGEVQEAQIVANEEASLSDDGLIARPPVTDHAGGRKHGRVLIVDDHPINRSLLRLMVEGADYLAEEAPDGRSAVSMNLETEFDVILMDVRMPGMDGLEASRQIRRQAQRPYVPIIAVTADTLAEDASACLAAGMDSHVTKPVSRERLLAMIDQLVQDGRQRQAQRVPAQG